MECRSKCGVVESVECGSERLFGGGSQTAAVKCSSDARTVFERAQQLPTDALGISDLLLYGARANEFTCPAILLRLCADTWTKTFMQLEWFVMATAVSVHSQSQTLPHRHELTSH